MSFDKISDNRRGAIRRGLGIAAGAFVAGGNQNPTGGLSTAQNEATLPKAAYHSGYGQKIAKGDYLPSPRETALKQLLNPLHEQMQKLESERYGDKVYGHVKSYQTALRSTSDHWKRCVAHDRWMAGQTEIDKLRQQIEALYSAPENKLMEALNNGIGEILAAVIES